MDLQAGVNQLWLISPLSTSRRPARPSGSIINLTAPPHTDFPFNPALEDDAGFQEIKKRLNEVKLYF
jgi:hypothetical protein